MELLEELGILVKMIKVVTMEHCFQHFLNFTTVNKAKQHVVSYIAVQTLCTAVTHPTSCAVDVHYINNMCHHLHKQHVTERQVHLPFSQAICPRVIGSRLSMHRVTGLENICNEPCGKRRSLVDINTRWGAMTQCALCKNCITSKQCLEAEPLLQHSKLHNLWQ